MQHIATAFDLGEPLESTSLGGGEGSTYKLCTRRGEFVVKGGQEPHSLALYQQVATTLNGAGVPQAQVFTTATGQLHVGGYAVFELLRGTGLDLPDPVQSAALMCYFARYNHALRTIAVPPDVHEVRTGWKKADSLSYLLTELPAQLARLPLSVFFQQITQTVLDRLAKVRSDLDRLPKQLVHGDVGPGNILFTSDDVVAIIDFTPYYESHLYAVCVSFFWHYVYGNGGTVDVARIVDDLRIYAQHHGLSPAERALFPAIFLKVAARILFVPCLLMLDSGQVAVDQDADRRAAATQDIMACHTIFERLVANL